jgi:hypothetical protein
MKRDQYPHCASNNTNMAEHPFGLFTIGFEGSSTDVYYLDKPTLKLIDLIPLWTGNLGSNAFKAIKANEVTIVL